MMNGRMPKREIANLLEVYLKNENYDVRKFYNQMDALAYAVKEPVSLAILDVKCFYSSERPKPGIPA